VKQIKTFENCIQSIVALEPCYGPEGGNSTRIYTRQGDLIQDNRRLKTILAKMLKFYGYDLVELRNKYKNYLGCGQCVPLPISHQLALVSLKMRHPLVENDGASGYVSVTDIVKITEEESINSVEQIKCRLYLNGGSIVPCCFTRQVVEKRLNQGRLALDHYRYLHSQTGNLKPLPLITAEQVENGSDLYEKINVISSFLYQFLADARV
jgi:hypothetical protein